MGRPKGSTNKFTKDVRDQIEAAFNKINGPGNAGLIQLAEDQPQIFWSLVSRIIPQQATLAVSHTLIDLGDAMEAARDRLENMEPANVIEAQPVDGDENS
tara:strand:- start:73 stop:372 length:300 start_codon:yes stop_codon:yes gene_type:complete